MKHKIKVFIEKLHILIWKIKNRKDYAILDTLRNDLKILKGGEKYGVWKDKRTYIRYRRIS